MTATARKFSLKQFLYDYQHTLIPALVYTIELTVWAVLNLKGVGDIGRASWRVSLLLSVLFVCFSGPVFNKRDVGLLMYGSVVPWGGILIGSSIYGFIQMNLNFLTVDVFYAGVFGSLAMQLINTVIQATENNRN